MNIALLGIDDDALNLVREIAGGVRYELAAVFDVTRDRETIRELVPAAAFDGDWENLLHASEIDAVIVGRSGDADVRADQLRKLVQAGMPLLLVHPACPSIIGYELDMIRRDTGCVMQYYAPQAFHPAVARLADLAAQGAAGEIGIVEQLVMERSQQHRDRQSVLAQLSRDADLVRRLLVDIKQVSALGTGTDSDSLASLGVNMSGPGGSLIRWSIGPAARGAQTAVTLLGTRGKATLTAVDGESDWEVAVSVGGNVPQATRFAGNPPRDVLESMKLLISDRSLPSRWPDACRSSEIAEAAERSARRGRTVQLYDEQHTEEQTFKGLMSAGGCVILLIALVLLLVLAIIDGLMIPLRHVDMGKLNHEQPVERTHLLLRIWPVYPLLVFLGLQLLRLVFRKQRRAG